MSTQEIQGPIPNWLPVTMQLGGMGAAASGGRGRAIGGGAMLAGTMLDAYNQYSKQTAPGGATVTQPIQWGGFAAPPATQAKQEVPDFTLSNMWKLFSGGSGGGS